MIVFCTALLAEAKPLITHFELKQYRSLRSVRYFKGADIGLVITGSGAIASAAAISSYVSTLASLPDLVMNIGIAGAKPEFAKGEGFIIRRIRDAGSGKDYFPDLLIKSPWEESEIETHNVPVTDPEAVSLPLFDMEASGFFYASQLFLSPDSIQCLKIVSDYGHDEELRPEYVSAVIQNHIPNIETYISHWNRKAQKDDVITAFHEKWLGNISDRLSLTTTQTRQMTQWLRYALITGETELPDVERFPIPTNKTERNQNFEELRKYLLR